MQALKLLEVNYWKRWQEKKKKKKPALAPMTRPKRNTYLWRVMGLFGEGLGLSPALYKLYLFP